MAIAIEVIFLLFGGFLALYFFFPECQTSEEFWLKIGGFVNNLFRWTLLSIVFLMIVKAVVNFCR